MYDGRTVQLFDDCGAVDPGLQSQRCALIDGAVEEAAGFFKIDRSALGGFLCHAVCDLRFAQFRSVDPAGRNQSEVDELNRISRSAVSKQSLMLAVKPAENRRNDRPHERTVGNWYVDFVRLADIAQIRGSLEFPLLGRHSVLQQSLFAERFHLAV